MSPGQRKPSLGRAPFVDGLASQGFAIVPNVLAAAQREEVAAAFDVALAQRPGTRKGLEVEAVRYLATSNMLRRLVLPVLGMQSFVVRATLFDKTRASNWLVAWHQDRVIPVRERRPARDCGAWSQKQGMWFVEPPAAVLRSMMAVRIDLDGSDHRNGGLWVLPGSHQEGVLGRVRLDELVGTVTPQLCVVPPGGALLMRPLLVHASSRAASPTHRRIVHLEFAAQSLPHGLEFLHRLPFEAGAE